MALASIPHWRAFGPNSAQKRSAVNAAQARRTGTGQEKYTNLAVPLPMART